MTMWKQWTLPKNEGTRLHEFGDARICVAVDTAGEGDVLAAMPIYPATAVASKPAARKPSGRKPAFTLPPLGDKAWTRFYMGREENYSLVPAYPPLPVCIHLRESFFLSPGATLEGWIFSKLEARIIANDVHVVSFPLQRPFKTLYGTPEAGVVCRYDEAEFLASREPIVSSFIAHPGFVAHPVRLRNASSAPVLVSDLCIYGEQLSIFGVESKMQSERILFVFSSGGVRMSLDGQAPLPPGATTIVRPEVSGEERFIVRSFELFKTMTRI